MTHAPGARTRFHLARRCDETTCTDDASRPLTCACVWRTWQAAANKKLVQQMGGVNGFMPKNNNAAPPGKAPQGGGVGAANGAAKKPLKV